MKCVESLKNVVKQFEGFCIWEREKYVLSLGRNSEFENYINVIRLCEGIMIYRPT